MKKTESEGLFFSPMRVNDLYFYGRSLVESTDFESRKKAHFPTMIECADGAIRFDLPSFS